MPDHSDDPILYPPELPSLGVATPVDDPFYKELATLYDNPEVFFDPASPILPRFRFVNPILPDRPTVLTIEITDDLLIALREQAFAMLRSAPGFDEAMNATYNATCWEDARAKILGDRQYLEGEREMYWFFIRHFPKLAVRIYDITMRAAVVHAVRSFTSETPEERRASERGIKEGLAVMVRALRTEIQQMLGTRTRGGSISKLADDLRGSLHVHYDRVYEVAKPIKKQYDSLRKTFQSSRNRAGLDEWQQFWKDSAAKLFPDIDPSFLALFSSADNPSTSDVSYSWISQRTELSQSYVRKKVKELRRATRTKAPSIEANQGAAS